MKQYRRYRKSAATPLASKALLMRKRIARNRRRAKWVGVLYLLATIALAVVACFPLLAHDLAPIGVAEFYKSFMPENLEGFTIEKTDTLISLINSALYAVLLLAVWINVFKALGRLGWLCKKKGNKTHGFNRNVYAMEDMGRAFSGSFAAIVSVYFLIAILCCVENLFKNLTYLMLVVVGVGIAIRLLLGFLGAKIAYYDYENGEIVEERRKVGRIAPLIRNLLQFAAIGGILYFFDYKGMGETIRSLTSRDGISTLIGDMGALIVFAAQAIIVLCSFVLIAHATNVTEYNFYGARGSGMRNFRVFSFFIFLAAGVAFAYQATSIKEDLLSNRFLCIAAIAFGIFLIEVIMRKRPKLPGEQQKKNKKQGEEEEEFSFDAFTRYQQAQAKLATQQPQPQLQISMFK